MSRSAFTLLMLTGLGCGSGAGVSGQPVPSGQDKAPITLSLNQARYTSADTMVVTIANHTQREYGFNPCGSRVFQRQLGNEWLDVDEGSRICTQELLILGPGQEWSGVVELPHEVPAGTYRLRMRLEPTAMMQPSTNEGEVWATSESFPLLS